MNISVAIPTFNSSATIGRTLESVLEQTFSPGEIVIVDDGSTDSTVSIVESYGHRIRLLRQNNNGVAAARNVLADETNGDVIAFLDHDDIWHPQYLEIQREIFERYQDIGVSFCGHINFTGNMGYDWSGRFEFSVSELRLLDPTEFFREYNMYTGPFGSMSYCCVSKRTLESIGREPFRVSGVDDSYFFSLVSLLGRKISYYLTSLVAYRVTSTAQSHDQLKGMRLWVDAFDLLEPQFEERATPELLRIFRERFAGKRRTYAKTLMGAGHAGAARRELRAAFLRSVKVLSKSKSLAFLGATYLPRLIQPQWPGDTRNVSKIAP